MPVRLLFRRPWRGHPLWYWLAALALAGCTAAFVGRGLDAAATAQRSYGTTRAVAVATRHLDAGHVITTGDVTIEQLPVVAAPGDDVLTDAPVGRVVRAGIAAGEPVRAERVAPDGLSSLAGRLPDGTVGVAVPQPDGAALALRPGDRVDAFATFASEPTDRPTIVVAAGAWVIDVDGTTAVLAVPRDEGARLAYALSTGSVVLAITATPPG